MDVELSCPICGNYFTDVVETPCCGNGFCRACLDQSLQVTHGTCPHCRKTIDIFTCTPNRLVQRMVDNLPEKCIYPLCTAKLTRSILQEHIAKCEFREKSNVPTCQIHRHPLEFTCSLCNVLVCGYCMLVGTHRYHKIATTQFWQATRNIASISSVVPSLPVNAASFPIKVSKVLRDLTAVNITLQSPGVPQPDQPTGDEGKKEEEEIALPVSEDEEEFRSLVLASFVCYHNQVPLTVDSLLEVLYSARITLRNRITAEFIVQHSKYLYEMFDIFESKSKSAQIHEEKDNKANNNNVFDYEQLKEKYKSTNFNFEGIQIKAVPLCQHLYPKVKNHVYVLLELRAGKKAKEETNRKAFSLAMVLDRSGSMSGSKLEQSKNAIVKVIESLAPEDDLSFIQYDDRAQVLFSGGKVAQSQEMIKAVREVRDGGSTNLEAGLYEGFNSIRSSHLENRKIFLFSDGVANVGRTGFNDLAKMVDSYYEKGVGVSTFGIGRDFDEKMMRGLSEHGNGTYFFIDSSEAIPGIIEKAFRGLNRTVATHVVLKVKGHNGVSVKKLNSNDDLFKGLALGDIRESDLKQILLEVEIEPDASSAIDSVLEVLSFELSYKKSDASLPDGPIRGELSLSITNSFDKLHEYSNEALIYLRINDCSELDKQVLQAFDRYEYDEAYALKKQVVDILTELVPLDELGFSQVLLKKAKERLEEIKHLGISRKERSSYYVDATSLRKAIHKEQMEEEDEDMGFGLFD